MELGISVLGSVGMIYRVPIVLYGSSCSRVVFSALLLRRTFSAIGWESTLPAEPSEGTQEHRRQQPGTCQGACSFSGYLRSGLYDPCVQSRPRRLIGVSFQLTGRVSVIPSESNSPTVGAYHRLSASEATHTSRRVFPGVLLLRFADG